MSEVVRFDATVGEGVVAGVRLTGAGLAAATGAGGPGGVTFATFFAQPAVSNMSASPLEQATIAFFISQLLLFRVLDHLNYFYTSTRQKKITSIRYFFRPRVILC
jgi:hypothetical protein